MRAAVLAALAFVALSGTGAGWLDPHHTAREASRLYAQGKFDDATAKYNEALVDDPDSPLLHYNLGDAAYRQGKFDDAVAALGQVAAAAAERDPSLTARAAYNAGNATYRLGAAAESAEPQKALQLYAQALVAYRRAMGADPSDEDAKFNHELVEKKMADLKKKLEEQQKTQDEQKKNDQQQQDQQSKDQQSKDQQQKDQQQQQEDQQKGQDEGQQAKDAEQKPEDEQQKDGQAKPQPQKGDDPKHEQQAGGSAAAGADDKSQLAPRDAEALLDAQRDQEVRPDEVVKHLKGAGVAEPAEDW